MIECELGDQDCELAVTNLRKARKSAVEARWRSGDVEDCKSAAAPASRPIVRTIHALFYPPDSAGFRRHCELSPYFPRRSSSRSTASRMKAGLPYVPAIASIRASTSGANRTGTGFRLSGGRPMRGSVAGAVAVRKKTILFSVDPINDAVYVNGIVFGGKR